MDVKSIGCDVPFRLEVYACLRCDRPLSEHYNGMDDLGNFYICRDGYKVHTDNPVSRLVER